MSVEVLNFKPKTWHLGPTQPLRRYVDLEALIRLLATFNQSTGLASLLFPRLDHLRLHDPSEGRFPRDLAALLARNAPTQQPPTLTPEQKQAFSTQQHRLTWDVAYRESVFPDNSLPALLQYLATTTDSGQSRFHDLYLGRLCYVSCWHLGPVESHAMWRVYSRDRGVAIKTTVGRLARSLGIADDAYVGRVQYSKDAMQAQWPDAVLATRFPFAFWKRPPFKYEQEVRVVMPQGLSESFFKDDEIGRPVPVRLLDLVSEIIVSPFGGQELFEMVRAVVSQFTPSVRVRRSTLLDLPPYGKP